MSEGILVANLDDIAEGEGIAIDKSITGTDDNIALLRDDDGAVWALDDTCTHETASLAEGWVEDGHVECPLHASKFCLKSGDVQGLPATRNTCPHRVEIRDGGIWLFPNETP
ncbi:non-heme iron oxygenase ferredoxin subunit [Nocardioides pocheonensis]|uniref:Non-heme iron oxygenase ferredoxin subunit n=1 Tax=Nocardioides pocheonensis TaxID=661485 RepID=A0A3N0GJ00_9ACTN|nr:non-heme iron oxygenase ferredoxin subunit [Nocardioides pocheonensis]RNM12098.1 non-heme iron oxygenase ferredoxin subunit [Nocardioides pocheonensis]